jgi:hypothetical protein
VRGKQHFVFVMVLDVWKTQQSLVLRKYKADENRMKYVELLIHHWVTYSYVQIYKLCHIQRQPEEIYGLVTDIIGRGSKSCSPKFI